MNKIRSIIEKYKSRSENPSLKQLQRIEMDIQTFNWFDENYIEEKEELFKILESACVKHACCIQSLYEACQVMKKYQSAKISIRRQIKYFTVLADHGINGYDAGEKLTTFFVIDNILHNYEL